jgi:uncharacterized protein YjbI with pentapeptide repeats
MKDRYLALIATVLFAALSVIGAVLMTNDDPTSIQRQGGVAVVTAGLVAFSVFLLETIRDTRMQGRAEYQTLLFHLATTRDLRGINLQGRDLRAAMLSKRSLDGANFAGADLRRADLSSASLVGADFSGADLREANLSAASLVGACLAGARLDKALLESADLRGAVLVDVLADQVFAPDIDARGARLQKAKLRGANLQGSRFNPLRRGDLDDVSSSEFIADLIAEIDEKGPRRSILDWADLGGAVLTNADLRWSSLIGTDLSFTYLGKHYDAHQSWSRYVRGKFSRGVRSYTSYRLTGSYRAADFSGATFGGTSLREALGPGIRLSRSQRRSAEEPPAVEWEPHQLERVLMAGEKEVRNSTGEMAHRLELARLFDNLQEYANIFTEDDLQCLRETVALAFYSHPPDEMDRLFDLLQIQLHAQTPGENEVLSDLLAQSLRTLALLARSMALQLEVPHRSQDTV